MSVKASLLILQLACAFGARFTDISHGARIVDSSHGTQAGSKQCDTDRLGHAQLWKVRSVPVPNIDDDVLCAPWLLDQESCDNFTTYPEWRRHVDNFQCADDNRRTLRETFANTRTLRVTQDGIFVQLAAEADLDFGPECVRISSSAKCEDEGEFIKENGKTILRSRTTYMPLKRPAMPEGDQAVGSWIGHGIAFTISAPAKEGESPKFNITHNSFHGRGKPEDWHGDLGEPDERQIRLVTLAGPYDGAREFKVRQLTGNSMAYVGYNDFEKFVVREYETKNTTIMASAFVCGRSTASSSWVPLKGFTWNYQSPKLKKFSFFYKPEAVDLFGPGWHPGSNQATFFGPRHSQETREWYYTAPPTTTSPSPSTTTTTNKATVTSTMHLVAALFIVVNVIGSSR